MKTLDLLVLQQVKGFGPVFIRQHAKSLLSNDILNVIEDYKPDQVQFYEQYYNKAMHYVAEADKHCAHVISFLSPNYPIQLQTIQNAPIVLYARGNMDLLSRRIVAIIGTRESSTLGNRIAERLGTYFSTYCSICNGLVEGIDEHAIKENGKVLPNVIGIISGGIDFENTCSSAHQRVISEVLDAGGLILSTFHPGEREKSFSGSIASSLQAQLSHGLILVQSSVTGGSKYTLESFCRLPRPIGVIEYKKSNEYESDVFGANRLILEKGKIGISEFTGIKDIKKIQTPSILPIRGSSDYEIFTKQMSNQNLSLF